MRSLISMHHIKRSIFVVIIFFFMNKELSKAIMHRSKLGNNFLRHRSNENRKKYPKQQNYCVSFLRRIKKNCHDNLNQKNITDNKKFWKTLTPFLSDKV